MNKQGWFLIATFTEHILGTLTLCKTRIQDMDQTETETPVPRGPTVFIVIISNNNSSCDHSLCYLLHQLSKDLDQSTDARTAMHRSPHPEIREPEIQGVSSGGSIRKGW